MEAGHVMRHPGGPEPLKDAGILERKVRDGKATKGWNSLDLPRLCSIFRFHYTNDGGANRAERCRLSGGL